MYLVDDRVGGVGDGHGRRRDDEVLLPLHHNIGAAVPSGVT